MKFKFCGNIDSPEWLISEIIFLTKFSAVKLRILCNNMVNLIVSDGKTLKEVKKFLEEMNFSEEDSLIIMSVLEFILKNAAKFDLEDIILNQELQQLGLPQENSDSISKVFKNQKENIKNKLKSSIFSFDKIIDVDYRISYILANSYTDFNTKVSQFDDFNLDSEDVTKESYKITNLESKIDLCFNLENNKQFNLTTNKEALGKLINNLEKSVEQIRKYKDN